MKCYGHSAPGLQTMDLQGKLIVIEGPDGVGRSTHIDKLTTWLEGQGHAVMHVGLSRSTLAGPELEEAKAGHALRPYPMALFYAADFFDQLENRVVPALRAGIVVLADRYVHTLMARAIVRGTSSERLARVYEGALVPHLVIKLHAQPKVLVERLLHREGELDYWESGIDLGLSNDWYTSFVRYQKRIHRTWKDLHATHPYTQVSSDRSMDVVQADIRDLVRPLL